MDHSLASLHDSSSSNWAMADLIIGTTDISIYCWTKPPSSNMRPSVTLSRAASRGSGGGVFEGIGSGGSRADAEKVELAAKMAGVEASPLVWGC